RGEPNPGIRPPMRAEDRPRQTEESHARLIRHVRIETLSRRQVPDRSVRQVRRAVVPQPRATVLDNAHLFLRAVEVAGRTLAGLDQEWQEAGDGERDPGNGRTDGRVDGFAGPTGGQLRDHRDGSGGIADDRDAAPGAVWWQGRRDGRDPGEG